jgi:hypothetical protein
MKKKFILWLCKVFKVELVEPMESIHKVHFIHERVPYTLIQDRVQLQLYPLFGGIEENIINQTKRDMLFRCITHMEKEGLITWDQFEDPMTRNTNIRCSFFVSPNKP